MATDYQSAGLTERRIRDLKPGPKTAFLWDNTVKGLGVRITPKGVKAFVLFYRVSGRKRLATLARCSELALKDARERAGRELAAIRDGEADPLTRREEARDAPTVNDGLDRFFGEFAPGRIAIGRMTERTANEYRKQAGCYLRPAIGAAKAADVTRRDIERMVQPMPGPTRNRVLAFTSRLFNLFEAWEWRPLHSNPAQRIERAREDARDRTLAPSELADLSRALADAEAGQPSAVAAIRVAALTGLRIGEVLGIQWPHVDFETGRLVLPETKTGRRSHDLPAPVLALLADLPRINGNPWVFASVRGSSAITYHTARKVFADVCKAAGIEGARLHDLRRTVMTNAAMAGVGTHVLRDLLGHKTTAMADRYIRAVGNPVREAREQVAGTMAAMMAGRENGDVVALRRR